MPYLLITPGKILIVEFYLPSVGAIFISLGLYQALTGRRLLGDHRLPRLLGAAPVGDQCASERARWGGAALVCFGLATLAFAAGDLRPGGMAAFTVFILASVVVVLVSLRRFGPAHARRTKRYSLFVAAVCAVAITGNESLVYYLSR